MSREPARPTSAPSRDRAWTLAVFGALAFVYWLCRSRSFGAGDSPEHVLSALTWGVSRPPGYPLYTALAHFFAKLPLGPAAGRVDGLSGLCAAAAAALFFRLLRRRGCGTSAALAATSLLAFSPLWWYYAEVAEVRALNDLLALAAASAAFELAPESPAEAWAVLGVLLGLGLSHHPTFVLVLPAVLFATLPARGGARSWALLGAC
ncbi:MAG: DUF2723 domain-containing protein, partial [Elusimicrobia bacterium]|nr:DUF2723 domain-containing protein [Elusimicrobiota bacterium]